MTRHRLAFAALLVTLLAAPLDAARIVVLFTNDTQGRISPRDLLGSRSAGGAPALLSIVEEVRRLS